MDGYRYCTSCAKAVTDFTQMSDSDIIKYLSTQKGEVCGRLRKSQINRAILLDKPIYSRYRSLTLLLPAIIGATATQAQQTFSEVKTEMLCETKGDTIPVQFQAYDVQETCTRRFRVVDEESKEPIPFCNISSSNKLYGVISDLDGYFNFEKVQAPLNPGDTIIFSSIGYCKKYITLQQLFSSPAETIHMVQLEVVMMGAIVQKRTVTKPFKRAYYRIKRLFTPY